MYLASVINEFLLTHHTNASRNTLVTRAATYVMFMGRGVNPALDDVNQVMVPETMDILPPLPPSTSG